MRARREKTPTTRAMASPRRASARTHATRIIIIVHAIVPSRTRASSRRDDDDRCAID